MSRAILYASSPLLASKTPIWRSKFIVASIAIGFAALAGRAVYIQVINNQFFKKQGELRFVRTLDLPANRGKILDRNGLILASSVVSPSVWAIPEDVEIDNANLVKLAKLLDMSVSELSKKLNDDDKSFVWLKRQVDAVSAKKIESLGIKGVYFRNEYKRKYPEGDAAASLMGFANVDGQGLGGIELAFNQALAGHAGSRRVIKDRLGQVVENVGEQLPPTAGRDQQLSIDSKVQFFAYQKLRDAVLENKAKSGSVVVLDVVTGEVLALANYPASSSGRQEGLNGAQLRNRALTDTFEPGSTMKPFVAALALEKGLVNPETVIQTAPGRITIGGATITDAHPHGELTVNQVIQKSSNVGIVKIAMQMQSREMWTMFNQLGFGQKPQLAFPGVVGGRLRAYKSWRPIEQATMSYGYGLSCSLFQLAHAYSVFARDGELIPITLTKTNEAAAGVSVLSPKNAIAVRHMLHMVTGDGGTAPKAQAVGYSVGGKTGTAHIQEGKGYANKKYRGFFVGMAPIEKPRIVVAVMIDEPSNGKYFGGDVAAPVFSETVQQTLRILGVQPDISVKPQIVTMAVEESF
ncbi:MAG: penicillin-binding protein 2 [Cellvibrio sp.]|uniref:peptidoglycan D,D-transpeptidase FtsI family protein n=1 Tax=Cellvibrio sp. TaxID=1965322 RepID=UPI002718E9CC|nr:penicillin-binding protein 2 [Cellvibrio sp.]